MPKALVTGADRGLGLALCEGLAARGWQVFAGEFMPEWPELRQLEARWPGQILRVPLDVTDSDSVRRAAHVVRDASGALDLLVNNAGVLSPRHLADRTIREPQDYQDMHRLFDVNSLGPLRVVEAFLPLMDRGTMKRLAFVSSEAGSIERSRRQSWFGYCMSKAALNMAVKILFNSLSPQGYTFRLYHPGWMRTYMSGERNLEADLEPEQAAAMALEYFLAGPEEEPSIDEARLAMRDFEGGHWPW